MKAWTNPLVDEMVEQIRHPGRRPERTPFRWSVNLSDDDVIDLRDGVRIERAQHTTQSDQHAWSIAVREAVARAEGAPSVALRPAPGTGSNGSNGSGGRGGSGGSGGSGGRGGSDLPRRSGPVPHPGAGGSVDALLRPKPVNRSRVALEWMVVFAAAVFVTLTLQLTTFQVFAIPSESMTPTLETGDRVVINKWAYRFGDVHRGDIVVFTKPEGADVDGSDLVKRVVAVAGDQLTIADDRVLIDGVPVDEPYLRPGTLTQAMGTYPCSPDRPCVIPPGQVFVMGDNRSASADSRVFGPIPTSSILGQVELRLWPVSDAGRL